MALSLPQIYSLSLNQATIDADHILLPLELACHAEERQVVEHYEAMTARLEAGKARKGADPERLNAKVWATRADQELRLQDLEKRYRLSLELTLTQLALVSYLKATAPLRLRQGKEVRLGVAIWDSLAREGYFAPLSC